MSLLWVMPACYQLNNWHLLLVLQSVTNILLLCIRWCRLVWIPSSEQSLLIFHCCVCHPHFKGHHFCDNTWRGGLAILPRHLLNTFIRIQYWVHSPAGDKDMLCLQLQKICLVLVNVSHDWETVMIMIDVSQMLTILLLLEVYSVVVKFLCIMQVFIHEHYWWREHTFFPCSSEAVTCTLYLGRVCISSSLSMNDAPVSLYLSLSLPTTVEQYLHQNTCLQPPSSSPTPTPVSHI